jgi:hypothetical protein
MQPRDLRTAGVAHRERNSDFAPERWRQSRNPGWFRIPAAPRLRPASGSWNHWKRTARLARMPDSLPEKPEFASFSDGKMRNLRGDRLLVEIDRMRTTSRP